MSLSTRPALLDGSGEGDDPLAEFRVTDPPVILGLLREIRDKAVQVSVVNSQGVGIASSVLSIDPDQGHISFTADDRNPNVQKLLRGNEAAAVCYIESVKLQFELHGLALVSGVEGSALQADIPPRLYRFQRRQGYRVKPLERGNPTVQFMHPNEPTRKMSLRVTDVSIGGCALLLPLNAPPIPGRTELQVVRADLDADTRFNCGMMIHHASPLRDLDGQLTGHKLGCEWLRMDGYAQRALQRYIDLVQRRRRMMSR